MTLDYENYGIFLIMGNAGFISSTVVQVFIKIPVWEYGRRKKKRSLICWVDNRHKSQ